MSEQSQVTQTTIDDVTRLGNLALSSSVTNIRVALSRTERRIMVLQARLVEMLNNEAIIKARMYNNADQKWIETNVPAGKNTQVEPTQSFQAVNNSLDPDHSVNYNKYNLLTVEPGLRIMDSELNRINHEIMYIQAQLREYENVRTFIKKKLDLAESNKTKVMSKVQNFLTPTPADLEADKIARAKAADILLLQRLAISYRGYSMNTETGERVFSSGDNKLPKNLLMIRQVFWAHAQSFPEFLDGDKALDFTDPGSDQNLKILTVEVDTQRYAAANTKTVIEVDRYVKELTNVANNSVISKGIDRTPTKELPPENSQRKKSSSYPMTAIRIGDLYLGSFELPDFTESVKKWWKKKQSKLYFGLPMCPDADPGTVTPDDTTQKQAATANEILAAEGADLFTKKINEAKKFQETLKNEALVNIPDAAPTWVKNYVLINGEISGKTMMYVDTLVTILRGTATIAITENTLFDIPDATIQRAVENAYKSAPIKYQFIDQYAYKSDSGQVVVYIMITT